MTLEFFQHHAGLKAEHPRVPEELAGFQVVNGHRERGLFDESGNPMPFHQGFTFFNVTVTRFGSRRRNAEGDQIPLGGEL